MSVPRRSSDVDDAIEDGDVLYELPLIDLTEDEDSDASGGLVDIRDRSEKLADKAKATKDVRSSAARAARYCPEEEIRFCRLRDGTAVKVGDTVELKKPEVRNQGLQSGDFLKIVKIVKNLNTDEISLRGHKYVREKYLLGRGSDGSAARLNELMMHFDVHENDNRPAQVQGLINVPPAEVKKKREIITTHKPYPMLSFRDAPAGTYQHIRSFDEIKKELFDRGILVCRWSKISIISPNGMVYGGIIRLLSHKEVITSSQHLNPKPRIVQPASVSASPTQSSHEARLREARLGKRAARTPSLETLDTPPPKRPNLHPLKKEQYSLFDMFCGAGGASRGGLNAGLQVLGGLDWDESAIGAWAQNFPGGLPFCADAFDFLEQNSHKIVGRVDILSISNPCQTFSGAHTRPGKNDEMNIKALDTIKPALEKLKPRIMVLENTSGLANIGKHKPHFNRLLRSIMSAGPGYSVVYKIINMADYGLPQPRKRLIIIAARRGIPLPPIPKPTHGPAGSGLKAFVSIGDALEPLERLGRRAQRDKYHRPDEMDRIQGEAYDPYTKFVDTIMTSGVTLIHPSGTRCFTPRELAYLQSLPPQHVLTGTRPNAIKQVGNMFPSLMAEDVYRSCAQTLEAFDHELIEADEEIEDLDTTLIEKGVSITELTSTSSSFIDLTGSSTQSQSPYRYLKPLRLTDATHSGHTSAWAERKLSGRAVPQLRRDRAPRVINEDGNSDTSSPATRDRKPPTHKSRQERWFWEQYNTQLIDLSLDSAEDEDEM